MRTSLFLLTLVLSSPALADLRVVPDSCAEAAVRCFTLTGLALSPGRPVAVGDSLVLVGIGPRPTGARNSLLAVDLALDGQPAVAAVTPLDATRTERLGRVEIAADGTVFAVFTFDERDDLNRNREVPAIQIFDEWGKRLGRVTAPSWWEALNGTDWSPVELMAHYAGTGALQMNDRAVSLRFGPYLFRAALETGAMEVVGPSADLGTSDPDAPDLAELMDGILVGAGYEALRLLPKLTLIAPYPSDGAPATLRLVRSPGLEPPDALGHFGEDQIELEPNANDYSRVYESIALSADGSFAAALRLADKSCEPTPIAYEIVVYDTATGMPVWQQSGQREGIVQLDLTFAPGDRLILTEARGALDPPCGPDPAAPAIAVTVFDPRPAP